MIEPQEFDYDSADEDGRSEDGDDDIIYIEKENGAGDSTLKWTTASTSHTFHDDEATQRSAGSQSQFSQSRAGQRALPSLITRKERRLLHRQQVETHEVIGVDEENDRDSDEYQECCDMDENGDEIFASIQDFIDKKEFMRHTPLSQIHTGAENDTTPDTNNASRDSNVDRSNSHFQSKSSIGGLNLHMSPSAEIDNVEDSCCSIEKSSFKNASNESRSSQAALASNGQGCDSEALGRHPSASSLSDWCSTSKSTVERFCDRGSGITPEAGDQYDRAGGDNLRPEVERTRGLSQPAVHSESFGVPSLSPSKMHDNKNMERISQGVKKKHRPNKKAREKHGILCDKSGDLLESQESLLLAARNNRKRRSKISKDKGHKCTTVGPRFSHSQSSSGGLGEPTQMAEMRSIVGSRPSHWSGSTTSVAASRKGLSKSNLTSTRAVALSQATRMRIPPPSRSEGNNKRRKSDHDVRKIVSQLPRRSTDPPKADLIRKCRNRVPSVTQLSQSGASDTQLTGRDSGWKENADVRCAKFAPSFLAQPKDSFVVETPLDATGIGEAKSPFVTKGGVLPHLSDYTKQSSKSSSSRKRKQSGLLMAKLRRIRSAVDGENVRFQSGAYPFSPKHRSDVNDPRNRAVSYADVTIAGEPLPWSNGEKRVTVLGYMHFACSKKMMNERINTSSGISSKSTKATLADSKFGSKDAISALNFPCFLWLCFTFDTAHARKIGHGVHLRIYNAVFIDPRCVEETLPAMLCTQICEPYPEALPPLPVIPEIAGKEVLCSDVPCVGLGSL